MKICLNAESVSNTICYCSSKIQLKVRAISLQSQNNCLFYIYPVTRRKLEKSASNKSKKSKSNNKPINPILTPFAKIIQNTAKGEACLTFFVCALNFFKKNDLAKICLGGQSSLFVI